MNTRERTEDDWMDLSLQAVADYMERQRQPATPMTEHEYLEPVGCSTLHPFKKAIDGGALEVEI